MNSAKKVVKNQGSKQEQKETSSKNKMKVLLVGGILLCVLFIGALCYEQFRPRVIATVGKDKIYLTDAMYDIYTTEYQYNSMSSLYQQIYGSDYWNMEVDDEGTKGSTQAKNDIMQKLQQRDVLCQEATKSKVSLTDTEKKKADEQVDSVMKNMTSKQKSMQGLSKSAITKVLEREALANKYKQMLIDGYDIDDAALKAKVSKKDYHQYDLQYYYVSTQTTDENNKTTDKTDAEKATLKSQMETLLEKAKTAKDFSKLLDDNDKSGIQYQTKDLVETDKDFLTKELRSQLKKMANGAISNVIEADNGYYIFRMDNNDDSKAYDNACTEAVTTEENKRFEEDYQTIAAGYDPQINKAQWNKVKLGSYTTK